MKLNHILLTLTASSMMAWAVSPQVIYESNCASCHGKKGEKNALGQSGVIQGITTDKFLKSVKGYASGELKANAMAKMVKQNFIKKYSEAEIEAVGAYLHTLK